MAPKKQRQKEFCPVRTKNGIRWKTIYRTRNKAHAAIQETLMARDTWGHMEEGQPSRPRRAYKCKRCGKFHLTKLPKTLKEDEEEDDGQNEEDDREESARAS